MRKTATTLSRVSFGERQLYCVTWPKAGKGRNRRFFKDKAAAETFLDRKRIEQENYGTAGTSFTERERAEYRECCELLSPYAVTLRDAVNFYLPHLQAANRTCTTAELVAELLEAKAADGASERYLSDLRSRLGQFASTFNRKAVAEFTAADIDGWLRSLGDKETGKRLAATTRNNFRRVLVVAFNFALSRGYCSGNPAEKSAKAKVIEGVVGILSVEQTARLLEAASPKLLPQLAIGAFAGLRSAELERLDWKEIDLESGLIEVTAPNAKSARRRYVKIKANLAEWLRPYAQPRGVVTPVGVRRLFDQAREAAGISHWPHNALRHGYGSYHLARFEDAAALALEMGNSPEMVFKHYRELVRPKQADRYWNIMPAVEAKNLVTFR